MDQMYDVIVIGGGAAATAAVLTLQNRGKSVAVISNNVNTSSLYKAEKITNYPGLPAMTGAEMSELFRRQIEDSSAVTISGRALSVMPMGDTFGVAVGSDFYMAKALIIAAVVALIEMFTVSDTGWIGAVMNLVSTASFACVELSRVIAA